MRSIPTVALFFVLVFGICVRAVSSACSDVWFDEVVTLTLVRSAAHWSDVFTLQHDNNHILNSLYLYLVGVSSPGWLLRLCSVSFGVALCLLPLSIEGSRKSRTEGHVLAGMLASSFFMTVYASEARGYAGCLLFSLILCRLPCCMTSDRIFIRVTLMSAVVTLGLLSHPLFFFTYSAYLAADCVAAVVDPKKGVTRVRILAGVLQVHLIPCTAAISYYLLFVRFLPPVSAPELPYMTTIVSALSQGFGGPEVVSLVSVSGALGLGLSALTLCATVFFLRRSQYCIHQKLFLFGVIFIAPLLGMIVARPPTLTERYLILSLLFMYAVLAGGIARMLTHGGASKVIGTGVCTVFLLLNAASIARFMVDGRGHLSEVLRIVATQSKGQAVPVGGDHDVRIGAMVKYYTSALVKSGSSQIVYVPGLLEGIAGGAEPEWMVSHHARLDYLPPAEWRSPQGNLFTLVLQTSRFGPSGFSFFLYRAR